METIQPVDWPMTNPILWLLSLSREMEHHLHNTVTVLFLRLRKLNLQVTAVVLRYYTLLHIVQLHLEDALAGYFGGK